MAKPNKESGDSGKSNQDSFNEKNTTKVNNKVKKKDQKTSTEGEVLLKLPGGWKYQLPGKRQRVILGFLVIGLNVFLVIAVILYFYVPSFQDFVYNVGR